MQQLCYELDLYGIGKTKPLHNRPPLDERRPLVRRKIGYAHRVVGLRLLDDSVAGLARVELLVDPLVGRGQTLIQRGRWLPSQYALDKAVVTVAAGYAPGRTEIVIAFRLHTGNPLDLANQCVDRH